MGVRYKISDNSGGRVGGLVVNGRLEKNRDRQKMMAIYIEFCEDGLGIHLF